jgi:hypothetical protein
MESGGVYGGGWRVGGVDVYGGGWRVRMVDGQYGRGWVDGGGRGQ